MRIRTHLLVGLAPTLTALGMAMPTANALEIDADGLTLTVQMNNPHDDPLTTTDRTKYCAAFQEASRLMWEATNGNHHYHTVNIYYEAAPPNRGQADVVWSRENGGPGVASQNLPGPNGFDGVLWMFDYKDKCVKEWFLDGSRQLQAELDCLDPNLTCVVPNPNLPPSENYRDSQCQDSNGNHLDASSQTWGFILAHELSHSIYNLRDEYVADEHPVAVEKNFQVCKGGPDNAGTSRTSMMAGWGRDHWCDDNTHVETRQFADDNGNLLFDAVGAPIMGSTGEHADGVWADAQIRSALFGEHPLNYDSAVGYNAGPYPTSLGFSCNFIQANGTDLPVEDALLVVDRSQSMSYQHPEHTSGRTALDSAAAAAVSYYNQARPTRSVGIMAFNEDVTTPVPYAQRGATPDLGPLALTTDGTTDLCKAIRDGADAIRAAYAAQGTPERGGLLILLTDGLPTTPTCNTDMEVMDAAVYACDRNVSTSPVLFGDADYELLGRVAGACNGMAIPLRKSIVTPQGDEVPTPLQVQAGLTRAGAHSRHQHRALSTETTINGQTNYTFQVPPASHGLTAEWMGDGFEHFIVGDAGAPPQADCSLDELNFELIGPGGTPYTTGDRPVSGESSYLSKTITIDNPAAGTWTARITPSSLYVCRPGAPLPHSWGPYDPRVALEVGYRNTTYDPGVRLDRPIVGRNQSSHIQAWVSAGGDTRVADMNAVAVVTSGTSAELVSLFDDGLHDDGVADDGLYGGDFNPGGNAQYEPGPYEVVVLLESVAGTGRVVFEGDPLFGGGRGEIGPADAFTMTERTMLSVEDCQETAQGVAPDECMPDRAVPQSHNPVHPCSVALTPGQLATDVRVETHGIVLGSGNVAIGIGANAEVSNVRATYDPTTGEGEVLFDAFVYPGASGGERTVYVSYAGQQVDSTVCLAGNVAPGLSNQCYASPSAANCCGPQHDVYNGNGWPNLIVRSSAPNPDCIFAQGSFDEVWASHGADFVSGGSGDDEIFAGGDDDVVLGETGDDSMFVGGGQRHRDGWLGRRPPVG